MILTKEQLIAALEGEVKLILHLASKAEGTNLDYRPTPKQRSTIELLRYLAMFAPIHMRAVLAPAFDMEAWKKAWTTGETETKAMTLGEARDAIGRHSALFSSELGNCSDAFLQAEFEMFGMKSTRAALLISLVLCHYSAYRMQLFMNLKASGREEMNTFNLWVGVDGKM